MKTEQFWLVTMFLQLYEIILVMFSGKKILGVKKWQLTIAHSLCIHLSYSYNFFSFLVDKNGSSFTYEHGGTDDLEENTTGDERGDQEKPITGMYMYILWVNWLAYSAYNTSSSEQKGSC